MTADFMVDDALAVARFSGHESFALRYAWLPKAYKALKADPLVDFPAKRTDPIRLLDRASGYDDSWFDKLALERDLKTVLDRGRELAESPASLAAIQPAQKQILANRMAFVLRGATSRQPGLKMQAAMLAARLGLAAGECDWPAALRDFLRAGALAPLLHDLPARELRPTLEFLWAQDAAGTRTALLGQLKHLHFGVLQEALAILLKQGAGEDCRQIFAEACASHLIRQEMLLWVLRNSQQAEEWDLPPPTVLAPLAVEELEQDYMGDRLKTQKLLREKFEDAEWLRRVFDGMTPGRQKDFFKRLNTSSAWPGLDRQVMQAKVLKLMPVIFTFFFLWFPAGLVLYWVVNNILSIAQQWYITRQIEQAEKWLHAQPRDARLLLTLAQLCSARHLWGKAQSYLEASLAIAPSTEAHVRMAELKTHSGLSTEACQHYQKALELCRQA